MLRIDTGAQLIDNHYYQVLGDKREGGTGDTQINWRATRKREVAESAKTTLL